MHPRPSMLIPLYGCFPVLLGVLSSVCAFLLLDADSRFNRRWSISEGVPSFGLVSSGMCPLWTSLSPCVLGLGRCASVSVSVWCASMG